jgi:hypothetical protein
MSTQPETINLDLSREEAALILTIRNLGFGYIEGINVQNGSPIQWKGVVARVDLTKPHQRKSLDELTHALKLTNPAVREEFEQALGPIQEPVEEESEENSDENA